MTLAQAVHRLTLAFEAAEAEAASENNGVTLFAKNLELKVGTKAEDVEILCCAVSAGQLPLLESVIAGKGVKRKLLQSIRDALKARSEQRNAANGAQVPFTPPKINPQTGDDTIINVTP
jgi:hypothetical protein